MGIAPEALKVLFEQIGPDRFEIDGQKVLELDGLLVRQILGTLQQAPAADRRLSSAWLPWP